MGGRLRAYWILVGWCGPARLWLAGAGAGRGVCARADGILLAGASAGRSVRAVFAELWLAGADSGRGVCSRGVKSELSKLPSTIAWERAGQSVRAETGVSSVPCKQIGFPFAEGKCCIVCWRWQKMPSTDLLMLVSLWNLILSKGTRPFGVTS